MSIAGWIALSVVAFGCLVFMACFAVLIALLIKTIKDM